VGELHGQPQCWGCQGLLVRAVWHFLLQLDTRCVTYRHRVAVLYECFERCGGNSADELEVSLVESYLHYMQPMTFAGFTTQLTYNHKR
jgi:hypothetical protein